MSEEKELEDRCEEETDENPENQEEQETEESLESQIELYDVGRVVTGPFKEGYEFIASDEVEKYITDPEALARIRKFHKDRKGISQEDFDLLNYAWVEAIRAGELKVDPSELVYKDVRERFDQVRANGDEVYLLTSGSTDLIEFLIGDECQYDGMLVGEDIGDKNHAETFAKVPDLLPKPVKAFYDDKPTVLYAAYEGFQQAGVNPDVYLVDRHEKVDQETVDDLAGKGIPKITSFHEIQ